MGDELVFNITNGYIKEMPAVKLEALGFKERSDLQRWVEQYPEIVGSDLLVLTTEFDQWELRTQRVEDRLDLLFLDSNGALVVAELKRGEAPDTVDLQALKYAAYCSQLTVEDVVEAYSRYRTVSTDDARAEILDHAPSLHNNELGAVRIRLVAESFRPSVTTTVLWLQDLGLDIGCIEVSPRSLADGNYVVTTRQLLPLPEAEEYLVKRRRKERAEEQHASSTRSKDTVVVLLELEAIEPETELSLNLERFKPEEREAIEPEVRSTPSMARAYWTGLGSRRALRWQHDGKTYSATGLVKQILQMHGCEVHPLPGPQYWKVPDGRTLLGVAQDFEQEASGSEPGSGGG